MQAARNLASLNFAELVKHCEVESDETIATKCTEKIFKILT